MKEWLQDIGIDGPNMVAGFSGGIVRVIFDRTSQPWQIVGTLLVGTLTATYLGGPIVEMLRIPPSWHLGAGFMVGFGGLDILARLVVWGMNRIGGPAAPEQKGPANAA